jgi:hypothetical protein
MKLVLIVTFHFREAKIIAAENTRLDFTLLSKHSRQNSHLHFGVIIITILLALPLLDKQHLREICSNATASDATLF